MNCLGLDPATCTGYAHSNGKVGTWLLDRVSRDWGERLCYLRAKLLEVHEQWGIDRIAIEDASFGSGGKNQWAATQVHLQIRGVILLVAASIGAELLHYTPTTIKLFATGSGRATKGQMMRACKTYFGFEPPDDNMADARFLLEMAKQYYQVEPTKKSSGKRSRRSKKSDVQTLF